jgi:hypothetical protein
MKHNSPGILAALVEESFQNLDDKQDWCVVVVQEQHLVSVYLAL